jgi:hypothetical protein
MVHFNMLARETESRGGEQSRESNDLGLLLITNKHLWGVVRSTDNPEMQEILKRQFSSMPTMISKDRSKAFMFDVSSMMRTPDKTSASRKAG